MIEHRSSNISHPGENVAHAQPSVSHEEDEIHFQILNMGRACIYVKSLKRMTGNQQPKELNKSQKMRLRVGLKMSRKRKPHISPWKTRKTTKLYSGKFRSIGEDGEEHYDVIDMEREAQRAVRGITDHQEIVNQYQNVVRSYSNFLKIIPG